MESTGEECSSVFMANCVKKMFSLNFPSWDRSSYTIPYASRLSYRKSAEPLAQLGLVIAVVDEADDQSSVASGDLAREEWY